MTGRIGLMLVAGAVAALAITTTGGAQGQGGRTIVLYAAELDSTFTYVDNKPFKRRRGSTPRRTSVGDGLIIRSNRYSDPELNDRAGVSHSSCTALNASRTPSRVRFTCHGVIVLSDGTVTAEGLLGTAAGVSAITGGTGAYEGARGQTTVERLENGSYRYTLHLLAG